MFGRVLTWSWPWWARNTRLHTYLTLLKIEMLSGKPGSDPNGAPTYVLMVLLMVPNHPLKAYQDSSLVPRPPLFLPFICIHKIIHKNGGPASALVYHWTQMESKNGRGLGTRLARTPVFRHKVCDLQYMIFMVLVWLVISEHTCNAFSWTNVLFAMQQAQKNGARWQKLFRDVVSHLAW